MNSCLVGKKAPKTRAAEPEILSFVFHSFFVLVKAWHLHYPHRITPPTAQSEVWMCYASGECPSLEVLTSNRDYKRSTKISVSCHSTGTPSDLFSLNLQVFKWLDLGQFSRFHIESSAAAKRCMHLPAYTWYTRQDCMRCVKLDFWWHFLRLRKWHQSPLKDKQWHNRSEYNV